MTTGRKILLHAPRVLLIAFALFLVVFSFDVFGAGLSPGETLIAFAVHNLPSVILGLVVFAAWRREWIGLIACVLLAAAWVAWASQRFPLPQSIIVYLFIAGPLLVIAMLYAINWRLRRAS